MVERIRGGQQFFAELATPSAVALWQAAEIRLVWLEAIFPSAYAVTPRKKIEIAQARGMGLSATKAARLYYVSPAAIKRYTREVKVALVSLLPSDHALKKRIYLSRADGGVLNRIREAQTLSEKISERVYSSRVQEKLESLPHLKTLLQHFARYLTVRYLLEQEGIPYEPAKIKNYNYNLRRFVLSAKACPMMTVRGLARKILFARWLKRRETLSDLATKKSIRQSINLAFATTDLKTRPLRLFWQALVQASYPLSENDVEETLDFQNQPYPPSLLLLLNSYLRQSRLACYESLVDEVPRLKYSFPAYAVKAISLGLDAVESAVIGCPPRTIGAQTEALRQTLTGALGEI